MKTAQDWQNEFPYRCSCECEGDSDEQIATIKQIQLDAMKEGMHKAAKITKRRQEVEFPGNFGLKTIIAAILNAAGQLTTKDLPQ